MRKMMRKGAIALLFLTGAAAVADDASATGNSPFGLTFTVQQQQLQSQGLAAVQQAFANAARIGGSLSFFWNWANDGELPLLTMCVKQAQMMGLKTVINVAVNAPPGITAPPGFNATFGDQATARKYITDVAYLASLKPTYLNLYAEGNVLAQFNAAEYKNFQKVYPFAYQIAKSTSPTTLVGTSYADLIWITFHQQGLPDQLGQHDFVGITTYPFNSYTSAAQIPATWYSQWRIAYPSAHLLFTEVGWGSAAPLTPSSQAAFLAALPRLMQNVEPEVVAYAMQYDGAFYNAAALTPAQVQSYQNMGVNPALLYSEFNSAGLFTSNGQPKPAWPVAQALSVNFAAPTQ